MEAMKTLRSSTTRLKRRVVEWGDEGGEELESHCSGCDFVCEPYLYEKNRLHKGLK